MSAAVLEAPGRARTVEVARPEPGAGQVRVRLEGCGICGSNLPLWEGRPWFEYPREPGAPGHEGWGVIDAVGEEVDRWATGDRVAFLSDHAFAEYDLAAADALARIPEPLAGRAFPGEALACAMNVFARTGIEAGQRVAIVGIGFLGAVLVQLATRAGARVTAVSRRPFARDVAREMGAAEAVSLERAADAFSAGLADCAIEVTGQQAPLDLAAELTRVRGRLIIAGYHQDGPRTVNMQLWNWRGLDVVNAHERDPRVYVAGIRSAADAIASGALDPEPLYTHRVPLDALGRGLELLRERPDGFLKALVLT
ncbi:MAG TPA: zinc-binding dehydrogenase [Gemmatimonadales bacterium]|nr:zinc-binding dehydrogenase [Gemmatimonadales bacterium]